MIRSLTSIVLAAGLAGASFAATPSALTIKDVVKPESLGAQITWLESQTGPAFKIDGNNRIYRLGGCDLGVMSEDGKTVASFRVELSDACTFDLTGFIADRSLPPLTQMTFGAFENGATGLRYMADCIKLCGNAYDPSVYGYWMGGRVDNMTNVLLEAKLVEDAAIDASLKWADSIHAAESEDYVVDGKYNCEPKYDAVASGLFKDVRISAITVGAVAAPTPNTCS